MRYAYLQLGIYALIAALQSIQGDIVLILTGDMVVTDLSIALIMVNVSLAILMVGKAYMNQNLSRKETK